MVRQQVARVAHGGVLRQVLQRVVVLLQHLDADECARPSYCFCGAAFPFQRCSNFFDTGQRYRFEVFVDFANQKSCCLNNFFNTPVPCSVAENLESIHIVVGSTPGFEGRYL